MNVLTPGPFTIYRFYDKRRRLLYVGMTHQPEKRFYTHAMKRPWFGEVAYGTLEISPNFFHAIGREHHIIAVERPLYNYPKRAKEKYGYCRLCVVWDRPCETF